MKGQCDCTPVKKISVMSNSHVAASFFKKRIILKKQRTLMIIVNLTGGLGNQLFQYATGRSVACKNNDELKLDVRRYLKQDDSREDFFMRTVDTPRDYKLNHFNITAGIASTDEAAALKNPYGPLSEVYRIVRAKVTQNYWTNYHPEIFKKKDNLYLNGFWQTELYFKDIRDTLLKELTLKIPLEQIVPDLLEMMKGPESVSLQIRRGDYVDNPVYNRYWGTCTASYYTRALAHIAEQTSGSLRVFAFSDDPEWVEHNISLPPNTCIVSKTYALKDYEELIAMSYCSHNIISNSTFGWWGAWLNNNPDKVVVAPTPWTDLHKDRHKDIIPESWIQLPKY